MPKELTDLITRIHESGVIVENDIIALRRLVYGDNYVARNEIDGLFDLNNADMPKSDKWPDFFVAAVTNFLLHQSKPSGYVNEDDAKWFIERITHDGHVENETELNALLTVLRQAKDATDYLVEFALREVKDAVVNGDGCLGRQRVGGTCRISLEDVKLVEAVLYASGGEDHIRVTQTEAELLFDLNDRCVPEPDAETAWRDVFVNGVTNSVMFYSHYKHPTRDEARQQEHWLNSRGDITMGKIVTEAVSITTVADTSFGMLKGKDKKAQQALETMREKRIQQEEKINAAEALWLTRRIAKDGVLHDNERALLKHLEKMCPDIHESLKPFIEAA